MAISVRICSPSGLIASGELIVSSYGWPQTAVVTELSTNNELHFDLNRPLKYWTFLPQESDTPFKLRPNMRKSSVTKFHLTEVEKPYDHSRWRITGVVFPNKTRLSSHELLCGICLQRFIGLAQLVDSIPSARQLFNCIQSARWRSSIHIMKTCRPARLCLQSQVRHVEEPTYIRLIFASISLFRSKTANSFSTRWSTIGHPKRILCSVKFGLRWNTPGRVASWRMRDSASSFLAYSVPCGMVLTSGRPDAAVPRSLLGSDSHSCPPWAQWFTNILPINSVPHPKECQSRGMWSSLHTCKWLTHADPRITWGTWSRISSLSLFSCKKSGQEWNDFNLVYLSAAVRFCPWKFLLVFGK